jgi:hypothetical protein
MTEPLFAAVGANGEADGDVIEDLQRLVLAILTETAIRAAYGDGA